MAEPNRSWTQQRGHEAEVAACRYLCSQGLVFVEQNFRCKHGELDLIMTVTDVLVFVEVRQRPHSHFGTAIESVTPAKCRKIARAAAYFLQSNRAFREHVCRFDVIGACNRNDKWEFDWIPDAFRL